MNNHILSFTLEEITRHDALLRTKSLHAHCLHYFPPSAGGWGIVRVGMLVPQSVMLFVAPPACGRHGAIAAVQLGFKDRLFYLHMDEVEMVLGGHVDKVSPAVAEIMEKTHPAPKALLVFVSCVDDLLGSDYEPILWELEATYGIPVRLCHMNPIANEGKTPPTLNIQKSIYSFLQGNGTKDNAVNIIGSFVPIEGSSEFYEVLAAAGIDTVRHIGNCQSIEELQAMGRSAYNILVRPEGKLAAAYMEQTLGIPFCYTPVSYSLHSISQHYKALELFLNISLETSQYEQVACRLIEDTRKKLGRVKIAVGSMMNANPFELSRALTEYGFDVRYIFCDEIVESDMAHIDWLFNNAPDMRVLTNMHHGMANFIEETVDIDLTIGLTAGYFCRCSRVVPLSFDILPYGYGGVVTLLKMMADAFEHPIDIKENLAKKVMII